jgi:hypothetical protein
MTVADLHSTETYTAYRPCGDMALEPAVAAITQAIGHCYAHQVKRLLIDTTALTGFKPPTMSQRYDMSTHWASAACGAIKIAFVARAEMLDPQRFAMTVANNRGLQTHVFTSEVEALAWLLDPATD